MPAARFGIENVAFELEIVAVLVTVPTLSVTVPVASEGTLTTMLAVCPTLILFAVIDNSGVDFLNVKLIVASIPLNDPVREAGPILVKVK